MTGIPLQSFATMLLFNIFAFIMKPNTNWDAIGIGASLACAVHCALLPLFLSSLPLFGINIINNNFFEAGMILLALCIGSYSLYHGYKKHHHSWIPLIVFFIGFIFDKKVLFQNFLIFLSSIKKIRKVCRALRFAPRAPSN